MTDPLNIFLTILAYDYYAIGTSSVVYTCIKREGH